jgi:hypothetical protein
MRYLIFIFIVSGCAPVASSVSKYKPCEVPSEYLSRYNSVNLGDSWNAVLSTMNDSPVIESNTQTYTNCNKFVFIFNGSVLVSKDTK